MSFSSYGKRSNLGLPSMIRCSIGNELKPKDDFTNNQLKKLTDMMAKGQRIPPNKGLIPCKYHSGPPPDELKCMGPCGAHKHVSEFSKNQRKAGDRRWCLKCIEWSETTGGRIVPLPASNNFRNQEEHFLLSENGRFLEYASEETGVAVEEQESALKAIEDTTADGDDSEIRGYGLSRQGLPGESNNISSNNSRGPPSPRAPHHLLPRMPFGGSRDTTTFLTESAPSNTSTVASYVAEPAKKKPEAQPVRYNAWGPDGMMVGRLKEPTLLSDTASVATTETTTSKTGWAKSSTRRQPIQLPSYLKYEQPDDAKAYFSDGDSDDTM